MANKAELVNNVATATGLTKKDATCLLYTSPSPRD